MSKESKSNQAYFKQYRLKLGFTRQDAATDFLAAKDIIPRVDLLYVRAFNKRLREIVDRINGVLSKEIRIDNPDSFKKERINRAFSVMSKSGILRNLNNYGRRPEEVYFNWMRGYVIQYLLTTESFKRAPTADLELSLKNGERIRIETQAGFLGINDIKQHKVLEAKRVFREKGLHTVVIHFDLYDGQVAFVKLDAIEESNVNWITRQQLEGQTVFNINQNYFIWKLIDAPPKYREINFD